MNKIFIIIPCQVSVNTFPGILKTCFVFIPWTGKNVYLVPKTNADITFDIYFQSTDVLF